MNSQIPDSQEHSETTVAVAVADCATKLLENFPRERSRLLTLLSAEPAGSRGATMTRTERNLRSKTSGVDSQQC